MSSTSSERNKEMQIVKYNSNVMVVRTTTMAKASSGKITNQPRMENWLNLLPVYIHFATAFLVLLFSIVFLLLLFAAVFLLLLFASYFLVLVCAIVIFVLTFATVFLLLVLATSFCY